MHLITIFGPASSNQYLAHLLLGPSLLSITLCCKN